MLKTEYDKSVKTINKSLQQENTVGNPNKRNWNFVYNKNVKK